MRTNRENQDGFSANRPSWTFGMLRKYSRDIGRRPSAALKLPCMVYATPFLQSSLAKEEAKWRRCPSGCVTELSRNRTMSRKVATSERPPGAGPSNVRADPSGPSRRKRGASRRIRRRGCRGPLRKASRTRQEGSGASKGDGGPSESLRCSA